MFDDDDDNDDAGGRANAFHGRGQGEDGFMLTTHWLVDKAIPGISLTLTDSATVQSPHQAVTQFLYYISPPQPQSLHVRDITITSASPGCYIG